MRPIILFAAGLAALTTAIPLEPPSSSSSTPVIAPAPSPSPSSSPSASASATPSSAPAPTVLHPAPSQSTEEQEKLNALLEKQEKESSDPLTCPITERFKACCHTIDQITAKLTKPIGKLIPALDGLTIASSLAFDCKPMGHDDGPEQCEDDAMCCSSDPKAGKTNTCVPYEHAMKKKKDALKKNQEVHGE